MSGEPIVDAIQRATGLHGFPLFLLCAGITALFVWVALWLGFRGFSHKKR